MTPLFATFLAGVITALICMFVDDANGDPYDAPKWTLSLFIICFIILVGLCGYWIGNYFVSR